MTSSSSVQFKRKENDFCFCFSTPEPAISKKVMSLFREIEKGASPSSPKERAFLLKLRWDFLQEVGIPLEIDVIWKNKAEISLRKAKMKRMMHFPFEIQNNASRLNWNLKQAFKEHFPLERSVSFEDLSCFSEEMEAVCSSLGEEIAQLFQKEKKEKNQFSSFKWNSYHSLMEFWVDEIEGSPLDQKKRALRAASLPRKFKGSIDLIVFRRTELKKMVEKREPYDLLLKKFKDLFSAVKFYRLLYVQMVTEETLYELYKTDHPHIGVKFTSDEVNQRILDVDLFLQKLRFNKARK